MTLSPKEIEVLTLVAMGYSDKQIGVDLKIAYGKIGRASCRERV